MMRALILFGFLGLFASSAWGQACKPVVWAFRHAEDTSAFALTPTGTAHAELYKTMVSNFETTVVVETPPDQKPCRVTKVYAVTLEDKEAPCGDACKNATNSFNTGTPLASDRMGVGAVPITTVAGSLKLYEYLGNGNTAPDKPDYSKPAGAALRAELIATANLGQSSAIFWTSQGLQVLGGVITQVMVNGVITNKDSAVPKKDGWALPPRNAVYLFKAIGSAPNIAGFEDTPTTASTPTHPVSSAVYVQCFNWLGPTTQPKIGERDEDNFIKPGSTQIYYCGFGVQSSPGGKPPDGCNVNNPDPLAKECGLIPNGRTKDLKGKICDTRTLLPDTHGSDVFGACQ